MSSAIDSMLIELSTAFPKLSAEGKKIIKFIEEHNETKRKEWAERKKEENNKIMFGKFKGNTVAQIMQMDKGSSYLSWLSKQTWWSSEPEKWGTLYTDVENALKSL